MIELFVDVGMAIGVLETLTRLLTKFVGSVNVESVVVRLVERGALPSMCACNGCWTGFERLLFKVPEDRFIPGKLFDIMVMVDGDWELENSEGREIFGKLL